MRINVEADEAASASPPKKRAGRALAVAATALASLPGLSAPAMAQSEVLERGAVLFAAAGCANCHTDRKNEGELLAGGRSLITPFGTFYAPNITPDPEHGIGDWSDEDFIRALREGVAPDGSHYFPSFPYTSYTNMTDEDMLAIKAYIFSLEPVAQEARPHELDFPYSQRWALPFWKWLHFEPGPKPLAEGAPDDVRRGAYLVEAVSHCGECHTPRDRLGGLDRSMWLAGSTDGAEGEKVPNITPDAATGIGDWSVDDITFLLGMGLLPDGDVVGSTMWEVVSDGTDQLSAEDQEAIAAYLMALPPIEHRP